MKCPKCGNFQSDVTNTYLAESETVVKRDRVCRVCNLQFLTTESITSYLFTESLADRMSMFRKARGVLCDPDNDEPAEETIRRLRGG